MPADLDLRKLRYFVALAEELHYGRAADRLHLAQPVLTRQIRSLETDLGVQLFSRDTRGTTLTPTGEALLDRARKLLASAAAIRNEIAPTHVLRVGVMPGLLVTRAVSAYESAAANARVELNRIGWDDQVAVLHERRLDLVYAREPIDTTGLSTRHLLDEPRRAVLPIDHPLVRSDAIDIRDLSTSALLQNPDVAPEWVGIATAGQLRAAKSLVPPSTVEEKLEGVASGRGFVILPESTSIFYRRPDVAVVSVSGLGPSRVTLAWPEDVIDLSRDRFIAAAIGNPPQTS